MKTFHFGMKHQALLWAWAWVSLLGASAWADAPYPYSTYITNITFNFGTAKTYSSHGDIWANTWAADNNIYTASGDSYGFSGTNKYSWVIGKMAGPFQSFTNTDVHYGPLNSGHGKVYSLLAISNTLYAWDNIQNYSDGNGDSVLLTSTDDGVSWITNSSCYFVETNDEFISGFVQFGSNYTANTDGYIYLYGMFSAKPGTFLGRVPIAGVTNKAQYQYVTNIDSNNQAHWGSNPSNAVPVFLDPNGLGGSADYDAPLGRWIFSGFPQPRDGGCVSLFEGPTLWGPWKTIYYTNNWANLGGSGGADDQVEDFGFPAKYISADGKTLGMFMSLYDTIHTAWNDDLLTMTVTLAVSSPSPVFAMPFMSNGQLVLTGSGGTPNGQYYILNTTNVALPLADWSPVLTNSFGDDGSFSNAISIDPSETEQFYTIEEVP